MCLKVFDINSDLELDIGKYPKTVQVVVDASIAYDPRYTDNYKNGAPARIGGRIKYGCNSFDFCKDIGIYKDVDVVEFLAICEGVRKAIAHGATSVILRCDNLNACEWANSIVPHKRCPLNEHYDFRKMRATLENFEVIQIKSGNNVAHYIVKRMYKSIHFRSGQITMRS